MYASHWPNDAKHIQSQGLYEWMASFLDGCERVVEVGTGDGSGTLAIRQKAKDVVSVEENPRCLDIARKNLETAGTSFDVDERNHEIRFRPGGVLFAFDSIKRPLSESGILLLGGIVGIDQELTDWLESVGPFDAIACWNIGTHLALAQKYQSLENFRLRTQKLLYELAPRILRPGGILHIVDRGFMPSAGHVETAIHEMIDRHQEQAEPTRMIVDASSATYRPYKAQEDGSGIPLVVGGPVDSSFDRSTQGLWSIVARNP